MVNLVQNYINSEDFAADESFQNFVQKTNNADVIFWNNYFISNKSKQAAMEEAIMLVSFFSPESKVLSSEEKPVIEEPQSGYNLKYILIPILAVLFFSISYFYIYSFKKEPNLIKKVADQQDVALILPDMSKVDMRKGSTLTISEDWANQKEREIWLDGEAYFNVKKLDNAKRKFTVHLSKGLIEVLGTKFLVKSDSTFTRVILEEGEISFKYNGQDYKLSPGDVLLINDQMVSINYKTDIRNYDNWRDSKLSFENKTVKEIITTINNSYNLNIKIGNLKLSNRKITASVNSQDPMILLQAIAEIYNIQLIKKTNEIILK
jgi:transmembrane sensor